MEIVLKTVEQNSEGQATNCDTTKYVRRNWGLFLAYYAVTSLVVGFGLMGAMVLFATLDHSRTSKPGPIPVHAPLLFFGAILAVVSGTMFFMQLISGPFVFTKDVVCRRCHTRLKVKRIAFFAGKYSRPPRCECGGKIEPAFLWKPQPSKINWLK